MITAGGPGCQWSSAWAPARRRRVDHLANFIRHLAAHRVAVGAHRAFQLDGLRQHVPGIAAFDARYAHHQRFQRAEAAAGQRLQRADDLAGGDDGIDALFRFGGVGAFAGDADLEAIDVGVERSGAGGEGAGGQLRRVMQTKYRRDVIQRAGVDQVPGAVEGLFRRLEEDAHRAGQLGLTRFEQVRGAEHHRGVKVVAAGVHHAAVCELKGTSAISSIGRRRCRRAGR
ncbi:hypothetical protein AK51_11250 [Serratia nematodiphila DZ0503SBS1]|nr:hypothetical protein AK51_11250 [Serratia nematodiphila DZ0503SBS1]